MQHTVRSVPSEVDDELRRRAQAEGKSLNQVAVEALAAGLGVSADRQRRRDLSFLAGSRPLDAETEQALAEMRVIDPEIWASVADR
jgi:plasmid stability protein